jgi:hypothetical protein
LGRIKACTPLDEDDLGQRLGFLLTIVVEAAVPNPDDQSAVSGREFGDELSAEAGLRLVLRAFAAAPLGADAPQLLISQAVAATGSSGGVVCGVRADRVVILAREGYTPDQGSACGPLVMGDLSLPLTRAATTKQPVWCRWPMRSIDSRASANWFRAANGLTRPCR